MANWYALLQRWIKQLFKVKKKRRSSPTIIERQYGQYCTVLRIERNTPGGLSTYRITSIHGSYDYLITLDYLPELLAAMAGEFQGTPLKPRSLGDSYNATLSHRFAVWRVFPNSNSTPIGIWDCDLEGFTQNFYLPTLAPCQAVAEVASLALLVVHRRETPLLSWQSQMECIDWLFFLEKRIREELSNPTHNLKAVDVLQEISE